MHGPLCVKIEGVVRDDGANLWGPPAESILAQT